MSHVLRFSCADIRSDDTQVLASRFQRLFGIMLRNKTSVFVKGHVAFPAEAIEDDQQRGMFLVDTRPHELDNQDVVAGLASRPRPVTEHKPERRLKHGFIGQLKAGFIVERQQSCGLKPASCLRSRGSDKSAANQRFAALAFSSGITKFRGGPTSGTRSLCQTFSRKASLRARRGLYFFFVRTVFVIFRATRSPCFA